MENIDGYFSGIIYINGKEKNILEFGYDIEFNNLKLFNCKNKLHNPDGILYDLDELSEIQEEYGGMLREEIGIYFK